MTFAHPPRDEGQADNHDSAGTFSSNTMVVTRIASTAGRSYTSTTSVQRAISHADTFLQAARSRSFHPFRAATDTTT